MAITLIQQFNLGNDTALRSRVQAAMQQVADSVRAELITAPFGGAQQPAAGANMNATRSTQRQSLAVAIRGNGMAGNVDAFARSVANNATCQGQATFAGDAVQATAAITDQNIVFVVGASWDAVAGVLPSNLP